MSGHSFVLRLVAATVCGCWAAAAVAQNQPAAPDGSPAQGPAPAQTPAAPPPPAADQPSAQTVPGAIPIPAISVTAPRQRAPQRPRIEVNAAQTAPASEPPASGTLPIVADQFGTITAVPREEIQRSGGATLGDLLNNKPGITGSSFAPGASSRPIVRGLDGNRVGVVADGTSANGASDLGEDHAVPVEPLASDKVEVIRGPAALRFGAQAIGGVVSASSNRIPEAVPDRGAATEFRGATTSVDNGVAGAIIVDTGRDNWAFHADFSGRTAKDYRIPSSPYRFDPSRPFNGRQPNSSQQSNETSVGASYILPTAFLALRSRKRTRSIIFPESMAKITTHASTCGRQR